MKRKNIQDEAFECLLDRKMIAIMVKNRKFAIRRFCYFGLKNMNYKNTSKNIIYNGFKDNN